MPTEPPKPTEPTNDEGMPVGSDQPKEPTEPTEPSQEVRVLWQRGGTSVQANPLNDFARSLHEQFCLLARQTSTNWLDILRLVEWDQLTVDQQNAYRIIAMTVATSIWQKDLAIKLRDG